MKLVSILSFYLLSTFSTLYGKGDNKIITHSFDRAEQQYTAMLKALPEPTAYPRTTDNNGKLRTTPLNDWTEGFYPGSLWYIYENNKQNTWKQEAIRWTEVLEPLKKQKGHHDIGFLIYCSFGNAYRLTKKEEYKQIIIEAANSLCTRFSPKTGCIKSWNYRKSWNGKDEWFYPVIIDNMMNLELLYFASKVTGDPHYAEIANSHAITTAREQFREDYSNYHVVNYDPETGKVLHKQPCQGFSDNSAWARGQAWAVYGYTACYRETQDTTFLNFAVKVADMIMNRVKTDDAIPYWDYDAPVTEETPRDASAASVTASALIELSTMVPDGKKYLDYAEKILKSLSGDAYLAKVGENQGFILMHSTGSLPNGSEIDTPLNYADYYYLEALKRFMDLKGISYKNL